MGLGATPTPSDKNAGVSQPSAETAIAGQKTEIDEMKPVTEQVKKWQMMGMGALAVVGIGGAAMGFTFAGAIQRVLALLAR
ncbi:DUF1515 domain-containing protein [Ensifer sp. MPMI2T]|nr:DUF1515 domain-containing protein [Ensifer sp. MPMI2T]